MSTKNLARTVIEGGRNRYNRWSRRQSHADLRAEERVYARDARLDPEQDDDRTWPRLDPVRRYFHDKLSPAERWLESQVGRSWNRVRAEMFERFDTRTLAGRHIVFDHMLPSRRDVDGTWRVERLTFRVDRQGILRRAPSRWPRWHRPPFVTTAEERAIRAFAEDRRVVARGERLYWLVPVVRFDGTRYRQHHALTEAEEETWRSFSPLARALVELIAAEASRE